MMKKIKDIVCLFLVNKDFIVSFKIMVFCNFVMKKFVKVLKCI